MTLREKQMLFAHMISQLLTWIYDETQHPGTQYAVTFGDAYRDPRVFGEMGRKETGSYGRKYSNHKVRLAIDLNLFTRNGTGAWIYCRETDDHKPVGLYWESLSPWCAWGGHFNDGNHYSFEHRGRR